MSAPVDLTALKAMLLDALTWANIKEGLDAPKPKVGTTHVPTPLGGWETTTGAAFYTDASQTTAFIIDADKLATTVAEWFAARDVAPQPAETISRAEVKELLAKQSAMMLDTMFRMVVEETRK